MREVLLILACVTTASLDLIFLAHDTLNILGVTGPPIAFEPIVVLNLLIVMLYLLNQNNEEEEK